MQITTKYCKLLQRTVAWGDFGLGGDFGRFWKHNSMWFHCLSDRPEMGFGVLFVWLPIKLYVLGKIFSILLKIGHFGSPEQCPLKSWKKVPCRMSAWQNQIWVLFCQFSDLITLKYPKLPNLPNLSIFCEKFGLRRGRPKSPHHIWEFWGDFGHLIKGLKTHFWYFRYGFKLFSF